MQHIGSLTEKWIEMASFLGNTKILFEPHPDMQTHPKKCNITHSGELNLYHTKKLKFISHNMNVPIALKAHFNMKTT